MATEKQILRRQFRQLRESFDQQSVEARSIAVTASLAEWSPLQNANTVLSYLAFRNELDLSSLFEQLPGIQWVVPRVDGPRMILHICDLEQLVRHRFGMLEPHPDLPLIEPQALDLVLVPGVAFDRRGGRLGFGGGYYDHFLPHTDALRVGITYDETLVDTLPVYEHDQLMHWIITPTQKLHCAKTS
jgi:5-formyltetrahydrofolate cyclo-ligase